MVTNKQILKTFGLENSMEEDSENNQSNTVGNYEESSTKQLVIPEASTDADYEFARQNLYVILENGNDALEYLIKIAKLNESARSFEVVADMIEKLTATNEKLISLREKKHALEKLENEDSGEGNNKTETLTFTTEQLQRVIEGNKKDNKNE